MNGSNQDKRRYASMAFGFSFVVHSLVMWGAYRVAPASMEDVIKPSNIYKSFREAPVLRISTSTSFRRPSRPSWFAEHPFDPFDPFGPPRAFRPSQRFRHFPRFRYPRSLHPSLGRIQFRRTPARITAEVVSTIGPLSPRQIEAVMEAHLEEIRYCYEEEPFDEFLPQGYLSLTSVLSPTGQIMHTRRIYTDLHHNGIESCIGSTLRRWQFPAIGGLVGVKFTLRFEQISEQGAARASG